MRQALVPLWGSKNEGVAPLWRFENTILGFLFWEKVIQVQNSTNITFSLNILCLAPICVLAPIWLFARTFLNFAINNENSKQATALSKEVWRLKKANQWTERDSVKWSIVCTAQPMKNEGSSKCRLCLVEKVHIATAPPRKLLNCRNELVSKCIHRRHFELRKFHKSPS